MGSSSIFITKQVWKNDKISVSKSFDSGAYHTGGGINDVCINKPNQNTTGNIYGNYEISSYGYGGPYAWYGEIASYYVNSSHQFVVRGGCGNAMNLVQGIFMSNLSKETGGGSIGFSPVLTI